MYISPSAIAVCTHMHAGVTTTKSGPDDKDKTSVKPPVESPKVGGLNGTANGLVSGVVTCMSAVFVSVSFVTFV